MKRLFILLFLLLCILRSDAKTEYWTATFRVSAYSWTGSMTKTEIWPHKGVISVDPKIIPLHTKLYVPGYGFGYAEDTGDAIKGYKLDVYFDTPQEEDEWGIKYKEVKVYGKKV